MGATIIAAITADLFEEFFSEDDAARLEVSAAELGGSFTRVNALTEGDGANAQVVITSWGAHPFDRRMLDALPALRLVAHTGASVKPFVTDALYDSGVVVIQAGAGMARSVAEVSLTFTLGLLHRMPQMHNALRETGTWYDEPAGVQHEILGTPIAVVGASRTGRCYLEMIKALGAVPLLVDPTLSVGEASRLGAELLPLAEALALAQVVALHAPSLPETHHLLGRRELALLRDGAGVVNTARSWLVDEAALLDELRNGRLSAAIDVFDEEPLSSSSAFRSVPGVLLTPHRAAGTREGRRRQGGIVADEVAAFAQGAPLRHAVARDDLPFMA